MSRQPEHRVNITVPAGETRLCICIFVNRLDELREVRLRGLSDAMIQQTMLDTVFVIPKRRERKVKP